MVFGSHSSPSSREGLGTVEEGGKMPQLTVSGTARGMQHGVCTGAEREVTQVEKGTLRAVPHGRVCNLKPTQDGVRTRGGGTRQSRELRKRSRPGGPPQGRSAVPSPLPPATLLPSCLCLSFLSSSPLGSEDRSLHLDGHKIKVKNNQ